jgi:hypothetical protein
LCAANDILARRGQAQFTLLDIPPLFELSNFRHRLLEQYVGNQAILEWWSTYFERLYESLRIDVINPVQTKIHRFSDHATVRNIVGQSSSTINFRELLNERRILLVNTATGVIGPDAGGLLGAVILDYLNFAVRDQSAIADASARARAVLVVDEFQSIPGVDYKGLLAELRKMGASFILATQALGQIDAIGLKLRETILSNIDSLFVFQTSAEDADLLRHELDESVSATDIINLDDYNCYVKTQFQGKRLRVMHVETLPPAVGDSAIVAQIGSLMSRYTRSIPFAESERRKFEDQWYGRERELLRQLMLQGHNVRRPPRSAEGKPGDSESSQAPPTKSDPPTRGPALPDRPAKELDGRRPDEARDSGAARQDADRRASEEKPVQSSPNTPENRERRDKPKAANP